MDLDRVAEGLPLYRRSVELRRQLLAAGPNDPHRILELADQLALLANVERHGGDPASARRDYAEAAALLGPIDTAAVDAEVQVPRGTYLIGEAMAAADQGQDAQALPLLRRAAELLTPFVASAREDIKPRQRLTEALWQQARLPARGRRCRRG